jgi:hypothetical protein
VELILDPGGFQPIIQPIDTSGSGDGRGTMIDIPDTESAKNKVSNMHESCCWVLVR